jgi:MFS family permease
LPDSKDAHIQFWRIVIILSSVAIVIEYAETMLFPAIPDIINDFKSSYSSSSWILSGYLITAAVMAPLAGKLSDVYAKKKVLSIIMTIFAASIAIASFSTSMAFLITVRIVQGVGLSMFIIALSIMQSNVPKQKYALANGILASTYFSGSSIGLVLGGSIIHYFGWRTLFLSLIPVVILLLVIVSRFLHVKQDEFQEIDNDTLLVKDKNRNEKNAERKNNDEDSKIDNYFAHVSNIKNTFFKSVDIMGAGLLAITISLFLTALTYMEDNDVNEYTNGLLLIVALLCSAIVSLILFIMVEKKTSSPLVNLKLITNKIIFSIVIMFLILGFTMFMVYQTVPILTRAPIPLGFGGSAITSSLVLLPFTLVFLILSPTVGIIVGKFGNIKLLMAGSIVSAIGYFSILLFHYTELQVAISLAIVSTGLALLNTIGMNIVMLSTPRQFGGTIIGMVRPHV